MTGYSVYAIFLAAIVFAWPKADRSSLLLVVGAIALASIEMAMRLSPP